MRNEEILARIAYDVVDLNPGCRKDTTIGITRELYAKLAPLEMLIPQDGKSVTLFGCKVKLIAARGLWWIVGYYGSAEEAET